MITTFIPYAEDKNLGREYNRCMHMVWELGDNKNWAILLDHDVMFTTYDWMDRIRAAIKVYPKAGAFTGVTNRIGGLYQKDPNAPKGDDMYKHVAYGQRKKGGITEMTKTDDRHLMGGFVMIVNANAWAETNGFPEGLVGIDHGFHKRLIHFGYKTYVIENLYLYHWRRGGASRHPQIPELR